MAPRVLVVDDSSFVRLSVARALEASGVDIVGFAKDGEEAVARNLELEPDVVVLDLQMPTVNGVEALRRIRETRPVPVLVFASMTHGGAALAVEALSEGAVDVLPKPSRAEFTVDLAARVWAIASSRDPRPRDQHARRRRAHRPRIVVVAASTGGPALVERLLRGLPADFPAPVVVAQHMPSTFTGPFARRLDGACGLRVFEARDGDSIGPGEATILPGGAVGTVARVADPDLARRNGFALAVDAGATLPGALPNASALFFSALGAAGGETCAVVLSGMGADGADTVPALLASGATVIVQEPAEAVIPSMPNAAIAAGAFEREQVDRIPGRLVHLLARAAEGPT